jgi:hypothetical protein
MTDKSPQQIYLIKAWSHHLEGDTIMRAFYDRMDAELDIDYQIDSLCKLAKEDSDAFEIETGYSKEYFDNEETMVSILRTIFHIEKVELY